MRIAIHQANFIPWFPFFYKMALVDKFIILGYVDFEKNNYQNRYYLNTKEKWVTKAVKKSGCRINEKIYADGKNLFYTNMQWIYAIRDTLNIKSTIQYDFIMEETKTERLIRLIKHYGGTTYITCPEAKDKYLDEDLMRAAGINIEYYTVPKHLKKHIFECFEEYGIDGTIKQLPIKNIEISKDQLGTGFRDDYLSKQASVTTVKGRLVPV